MAHVRIELLGGFRVSVGGRVVPDRAWRRRKPAALVKLLSLAPSHRLHREQIMDALWPELGPSAAGANLRKAVHHARRALGAGDGARVISSEADLLSLVTDELWIDVEGFRTALAAAHRAGDPDQYGRALDLYSEGLLPEDLYEEWALRPRHELHLEFVGASEELAGLLEARGDLDRAIDVVRRLIAAETLREESHVTLMRLHALAGRRQEALRQYEHLTQLLERELGSEPSAAAQRLYEEIRAKQADEPELTADLWERVGDLRVLSGDAAGAAKAFGLALDAGDLPGATARLERKCAEAWLMQHRPDAATPHLAAADKLATEPAERGRMLRARANHAWETGEIGAAREYAEQARDLARKHGTADDLAVAHEAVAIVSHCKGEWREGLEAELERLAADSTGQAELARVFDIHHCIGQYHLYGDGLAGSVEGYARRILDRAEDVGAVRAQAFAWCLLGESLLLQARWDEAVGCLERSCELHASLGTRSGGLPWQRRAELAVCRGAFDEADACLRHASGIATVSGMASHLWGRIHATRTFAAVEQGDSEEAVRSVRAAAAAAARYGDCPTCSALLNPMAAEAFAQLADGNSARAYAASAAQVAELFNSSAWRAMAESAAGSLARADGDDAVARRHFAAASDLYERSGQPYWSKRALGPVATGPA
ncbi:MAG: transcriptional regulator [Actinobacteria bacterium]|nr:transcriptional regulator [Actinomycetota bacterium]